MKRFLLIAYVCLIAVGCTTPVQDPELDVVEGTTQIEPEALHLESTITYSKAVTWVNSIGTTWVQVIVEIENTGEAPIYLSSGSYDLKDASGSIIASKSYVSEYPRVVSIGEKAYLYDETTLDLPVTGTLTVVPRINEKKATIQNKQDHPIGILDDLISDDFPAGAEMGFEATSLSMPDEITMSSVARYKTYAYPHQYQF